MKCTCELNGSACPTCGDLYHNPAYVDCPACEGYGAFVDYITAIDLQYEECDNCQGTGRVPAKDRASR